MNCDNGTELLMEYSLDQLDPVRTAEVREHLDKGCAVCAQKLNEFVEAWASLAAGLEPVSPSPEVEGKLLAMIRGQVALPMESADLGLPARDAREKLSRVLGYALAAALAGIATAALAWHFTPLGSTLANRQIIAPEAIWATAPSNESRTGFQTVALNPIAEKQGVRLSVAMMEQAREWHVIATGLPTVEPGERFQIWLESKSGDFVRSATLAVEAVLSDGEGSQGGVILKTDQIELATLAGLWLTVESSADGARPSKKVLFRAMVK